MLLKEIDTETIIDLQQSQDTREIAIQEVGIKALKHPFILEDEGQQQNVIAELAMRVSLEAHQRGTHMSRFIELLHEKQWILSSAGFYELLTLTRHRLDSNKALIDMSFPLFIEKSAPISGVKSFMDYRVGFKGWCTEHKTYVQAKVIVPVTTLCPCSKAISNYGAHNQRSEITVTVTVKETISFAKLISLIEKHASCELYGTLKRPDEKFVTEKAYDNPKFVEDMVREIALELDRQTDIIDYSVASENFESIHNHSAYAYLEKFQKA